MPETSGATCVAERRGDRLCALHGEVVAALDDLRVLRTDDGPDDAAHLFVAFDDRPRIDFVGSEFVHLRTSCLQDSCDGSSSKSIKTPIAKHPDKTSSRSTMNAPLKALRWRRSEPSWLPLALPYACFESIDQLGTSQQNSRKPPWRSLIQRCLALLARAARLDPGGSCDCGNGIADAWRDLRLAYKLQFTVGQDLRNDHASGSGVDVLDSDH